jgi:glycosyltransferase involved in cell wall biosynthesis
VRLAFFSFADADAAAILEPRTDEEDGRRRDTMRIAQVSPLYESVPPKFYGGTERVVSYLTEELVRLGHEVTLFASGDSVTSARLVPCCPTALRLAPGCIDMLAHHVVMLERVFSARDRFDVIHFHVDYVHFPLSRIYRPAHLTTLHGRLDIPDLVPLYREFPEMPVVSISDSQRAPLPWIKWAGTVRHGLPPDLHPLMPGDGGYLAFVGRVSPEKRLDRAVEIARRSGLPLRIAAKVDPADREYFERDIRPLLDDPNVLYLGELSEAEKADLIGHALALLFPVDWPEPFGLVMIEAMICGTPTIAWRNGSVPEVIEPEVSGLIVDSLDEAVEAVGRVRGLSRAGCRAAFLARFTSERMAREYVALYEHVASGEGPAAKGGGAGWKR